MLLIGNTQVNADIRNTVVTGLRVCSNLMQICATVRRVDQDTSLSGGTESPGASRGFRRLLSCHICPYRAFGSHRQRQCLRYVAYQVGAANCGRNQVSRYLADRRTAFCSQLAQIGVDLRMHPRLNLLARTLMWLSHDAIMAASTRYSGHDTPGAVMFL